MDHRNQTQGSGQPAGLPGRLAAYLPVLAAGLFMLPRLLAARFELFDDGRSLVSADKISHGIWYSYPDVLEGRFRPIHWLWFTLSYLIGGKNPFWFYLSNTLALMVISAALIFLVRRLGGSRLQAALAGLAFVLAGPVVESFYTLKGEVIQAALMVLSLLALLPYAAARTRRQKVAAGLLVVLVVFLAYLAKETTLVLLPVSAVWYLLARFWPEYEKDPARRSARGLYLAANLVCAPIFLVLRSISTSAGLNQGSYTVRYSFHLDQIAVSALRWVGWLVRDFTWVVPLVLAAAILIVARRRLVKSVLMLDALVWMAAWVCVYLPWNFMAEYYMLPFALGLAVFAAGLVVEVIPALRARGWQALTAALGVGLGLVLLTGNLLGNLTNARVQLAVDPADASMLAYLVQHAAPDSTVLVNLQDPNEYFYEMQMQLAQVYGRPDLKVVAFNTDITRADLSGTVYIVSPHVTNQPLLTVRMGVVEATQDAWNASLQNFLQSFPGSPVAFRVDDHFTMSDVNYPRIFCPLVKTRSFCATPAPFFDTRTFDYGWQVVQVSLP